MATRTRYYKAVQPTLAGPHFNNPTNQPYVVGSVHREPELNTWSAFGKGLHYVAHRRVASRWAPVVIEVSVLGDTFKIPEQVSPRYRADVPNDIQQGKYNKYRTNELRVERIVGIASYGLGSGRPGQDIPDEVVKRYPWSVGSYAAALDILHELNRTLVAHGKATVRLTGQRLETLRSDHFVLWEVEEVPFEDQLQRVTVTVDVNIFKALAPQQWRNDLERAVEGALGTRSYVQGVGLGHASPSDRAPLSV